MVKRLLILVLSLSIASGMVAQPGIPDWSDLNQGQSYSRDTIRQNGFTLVFINKQHDFDPVVGSRLIQTFFTVYPEEVKQYNRKATRQVVVIIDPAYTGVAAASSGIIRINPDWLKKNPEDIDVITHEAMHLVQSYPHRSGPGWITEGIADYVRHQLGVNNKASNWKLTPFKYEHHYTNAYRITARFFLWIEQRYKKGFVQQLDAAMRNNTYTDDFWMKSTGYTVDMLWLQYSKDPVVKGLPDVRSPLAYVNPMIGS